MDPYQVAMLDDVNTKGNKNIPLPPVKDELCLESVNFQDCWILE